MKHITKSFDEVGARLKRGGKPQKYFLDGPRRRLFMEKYDGSTETINELQRLLDVPRWVIHKWAAELGLTRQNEILWTPEEVKYLETNLYRTSVEKMAAHLGRTKVAVRVKAKRLGVNKCLQEGYTLNGLRLALGCTHFQIEKWIKNGWLRGRRRNTEKPDRDTWYFSDHAIRAFVFAHPNEINQHCVDWLWLIDVLSTNNARYGLGSLSVQYGEAEEEV